ncbi:glycosyltransferase family 4 protein [Gracilimonas tropica]|uniref:glycosyltransferase family 4 protein n=1 Tax=Gracilimonas tropica TaxID=454600 RepID=UPI00058C69D2|nr:glycosyltransferase family 4 protein [Gracilimonas tropica]
MNILQITPRLPFPPNDGGAVYIYYTTKYLSRLGHNVTLASLISNKHEQEAKALKKWATVHAVDGQFKPYSFFSAAKSLLSRSPITIQHRMKPELMRTALHAVNDTPDVVLLEGLHTAAFIDDIENIFPDSPVVLRQSNVEYLLLKRNAATTGNPFLKAFYYDQYKLMKKYEVKAMSSVDAVTAITRFDKELYLEHLPDLTCHVSPAGAEIPKPLGIKREKNKILAISNWRWKPNYDGLKWFLEKIWPDLIALKPDLKLFVAGEGLNNRFQRKFAHSSIQFLGFVDNLEPLRQSSSLFIAPLFSGSGMKLKVIEGMASGLPIITTKIGAEGIEIKNGTHYVEANSKKDFLNAILFLLDNPEKREQISRSAKQIVKEKYSWESITGDLVDFLKTVRKS